MKSLMPKFMLLAFICATLSINAVAQKKPGMLACRQEVFARLKPLPKLSYECRPDAANDYDEAILKRPERRSAISAYMRSLEAFSDHNWWETSVDELNVCYIQGRAGAMDAEESKKFKRGDYPIDLFGDGEVRLVIASDPCYQTGFGGSNAFLLYRRGQQGITVTQVLDGHFSRADNSVGLDFASLKGARVIEVSTTTGGLNPYTTSYYFTVDRRTGRAVPFRLLKDGRGRTNKITSVLILDDGSFPEAYREMQVIEGHRLAATFYTYEDAGERGRITDASGRKLQRTTYRWNGQFYMKVKR